MNSNVGKECFKYFRSGIIITAIALSVFFVSTNHCIGYTQSADSPVHQHIAWEAFHIWPNDYSHEIFTYLNEDTPWDQCETWNAVNGNTIIEGAWAEDEYDPASEVSFSFLNTGDTLSNFNQHFWECDDDDISTSGLPFSDPLDPFGDTFYFWSAVKKAMVYWGGTDGIEQYPWLYREGGIFWYELKSVNFSGLINLYINGDKDAAYFYLGRIVHLLSDMSVPAHVHNDAHVLFENYEKYYIKDHWHEIQHDEDSNGHELTLRPTEFKSLYDIFFNQAQLTQNFPSNNANGNIDGLPVGLENGWEWNRNLEFIVTPYIDSWPIAESDGWVGTAVNPNNTNLKLLADSLLPLNMMYVANLYKLFWDTVHPFPKNIHVVTNINGDVTLSWEDPENSNSVPTDSYKIYYGTVSGQLTNTIDNISSLSFTLDNLNVGTKYYFSLSALDAQGIESNQTEEYAFLAGFGRSDGPWPVYMHDVKHTGRSIYNGPPYPMLKWLYDSGTYPQWVGNAPAIDADGTIYFGSFEQTDGYFYAINPDGSLKWKYHTFTQMNCAPAIGSDGTIYVGGNNTFLYALNPDGGLKWSYQSPHIISYSSPVIGADGAIYIGTYTHDGTTGESIGTLDAINPDGSLRWQFPDMEGSAAYSAPAIGSDGTIYVSRNFLYAINPDGSLKWNYYIESSVSSPSIGSDGTIYIGSDSRYFYAINPDGSLKWRYYTGTFNNSSSAIGTDGTIYFKYVTSSHTYIYLCALNPDGSLKWQYRTTCYNYGMKSPPIIGADGTIYVGDSDNNFYAINPNGTLKWSYSTPGYCRGPAAIGSNGTIYFNTDGGHFYALGLPDVEKNFNGDDYSDILWHHDSNGQNVIWLMEGTSLKVVDPYVWLPTVTDTDWEIIDVADFDLDYVPDVLWRHATTGQNVIWAMDGTVVESYAWLETVADTTWRIVGLADFDQDGDQDILWRHNTSGKNVIWIMNGTAVDSYVWLETVADISWEIIEIADFDADNDPDILWRHTTSGQNVIWVMDGTIRSSYTWLDAVADINWEIKEVVDFDTDGDTDILWRHATSGQNVIWVMDGSAIDSYAWLETVGDTNWKIIDARDFDQDGDPDILWRHATTGQNVIWVMSGTSLDSYAWVDTVADMDWELK